MKSKKSADTSAGKCVACPAPCCRNLAMMILKPTTKSEIDDVKWYLHFDTVRVFIRNRRWYVLIKGNCIYLDEHNLCTIYDRRPDRCIRHPASDCEMTGEYYDVMITTPEELEDYFSRQKKRRRKNR